MCHFLVKTNEGHFLILGEMLALIDCLNCSLGTSTKKPIAQILEMLCCKYSVITGRVITSNLLSLESGNMV